MSRTIDERVVEMRFDNKQFESATKETLSTLTKLKEALKLTDSKKSLEGLDKSVKDIRLDGIAAGVDALNKRFSTMGIVGMQVIQNITNALTGTLAKGINFVTDSIVSGGIKRAMNLENAHFQLQSIIGDEIEVQKVMQAANDSVDGTAYSFDVAAKAASQLRASGVEDVDKLSTALRAMAGTAATFSADYEGIAMIFTQVAGKGRLMGDELLQLSSRGANGAATLANYFNGVNDGSIKASSNVAALVKQISGGARVTEGEIRDFTSKGRINFELFAEAMSYTFGDSAKKANDTFTGALSNIKAALARIGAGFVSPLVEQNSKIVELFNAVRLKINDVKKSLVFDESIGNINALSKQVTDFILNLAGSLTKFFENLNVTKPMQLFYYWVEIIKNSVKGIGSVLKPVGQAFKEVFLSFKIDDLIKFSESLNKFTKNLKLSETGSKNLKDAFTGLFNIGKLVIDIFVGLLKAIVPIHKPAGDLGGVFLSVAGAIGRTITSFVEFVRESALVSKAYELLSKAIRAVSDSLSFAITSVRNFIDRVSELEIVEKILETITILFSKLGEVAVPILEGIVGGIALVGSKIVGFIPKSSNDILETFTGLIGKLNDRLKELDLSKPIDWIAKFSNGIKQLIDNFKGSEGLNTFIDNFVGFFDKLKDALSVDSVLEKINKIKEVVGGFVTWIKETLVPAFGDISIGGVAAGAGGIGFMYMILKIAKSFESAVGTFKSIPEAFKALKGVLVAYQKELEAQRLLTVAKAIGILAASVAVLSLLDAEKVSQVAFGLGVAAALLIAAVTKLVTAFNAGISLTNTIDAFAKRLSQSLRNFTRALVIKSIGTAVKNFGESMLMIAGSLIAIALMYKNDKEALYASLEIVEGIAAVMLGIVAVLTSVGMYLDKGASTFKKVSQAVKNLSLSLGIIIFSINSLMKMKLPTDYGTKLGILTGIIVGLTAVSIVLAKGGNQYGEASASTKPLLAMSAALFLVVQSIKTLFNTNLSEGWQMKLTIVAGMLAVLTAIAVTLSEAGRESAGAIKATGTILAMCAFVGTITVSLMVLNLIPWTSLLKGAVALGGVLIALGQALKGASGIADKGAAKTVLAMAIEIAAITAALGVLSMIPVSKLTKAAVALGGVLLTIAAGLKQAANNISNNSVASVSTMIAATIAIAYEIYELSKQPWDSMLSAGTAMSEVLLSMAAAMKIMSTIQVDLNLLGTVLGGIIALLPISLAINELSKQPWQNLLAAGTAISEVMLSMSAALAVVTLVGNAVPAAIAGILAFDAFLANFVIVLAALGAINDKFGSLLGSGGNLLIQIAETIGSFVGAIIKGFTNQVLQILPSIGQALSDFSDKLQSFISGMRNIDGSALQGAINLAKMVVAITAAEFLQGITKFVTGGNNLTKFGNQLLSFGPQIVAFSQIVKMIDTAAVQGAAYVGQMMVQLANDLPRTGGLVQFFTGSQSISRFGASLVAYGVEVLAFSNVVKGIDPSSVTGAATIGKMMIELQNTLPKTGGLVQFFTGSNSLSDFGKGLLQFGKSMAAYAQSVAGIDTNQLSMVAYELRNLINASSMMAGLDTTAMSNFAKGLKDLANNAIQEFINAFQNGGIRVSETIRKEIENWTQTIKSKEGDLKRSGESTVKTFTGSVENTSKTEFGKIAKSMGDFALNIARGFSQGIDKNINIVTSSMTKMGSAALEGLRKQLKIHSPSGETESDGKNSVLGLSQGVINNLGIVSDAGHAMGDTLTQALSESLDMDAVFAAYGGLSNGGIIKHFMAPIKELANEAGKTTKNIQQRRKQNLEETKKTTSGSRAAHKEAIEEEKSYWSELLEVKKQGAEAEKYQSMSVADFKKQILEDTKNALQEYTSALESTRNSIMSQIDLFSEVEKKETVTKQKLVSNLKGQIKAYDEYVKTLTSLNERLGDSKLGEYLRQLGVDSVDQLKVINSMTDAELSNYSQLYDSKFALATEAASQQLVGMKAETEAKLAELFGGMANSVNLMDFSAIFDGSLASIEKYIQDVMIPFQNAQVEAENAAKAVSLAIANGLADETVLQGAGDNIGAQLDAMINHVKETTKSPAEDAGKEIGTNLTEGVSEGLTQDTSSISEKTTELMNLIENALKEAGEIHSPSARSNREVGVPITQGIAEGMVSEMGSIDEAVSEIMTNLIEKFNSQLEGVSSVATSLMQAMQSAIRLENDNFQDSGFNSIESFLLGVKEQFGPTENKTNELIETMMTIFKNRRVDYQTSGSNAIISFIQGVSDRIRDVNEKTKELVNSAIATFESMRGDFVRVGENASLGIAEGLRNRMDAVISAAREVARAAYEEAMSELDEHSPSKKMETVGDNATLGFANGLLLHLALAAKAGKETAKAYEEGMAESSSGFREIYSDYLIDNEPVIKPIVDISNIEMSVKDIQRLFNSAINTTKFSALETSGLITSRYHREKDVPIAKQEEPSSGTTINLTQNNYSPKALSRSDIYRQTKNQFSTLKGLVDK